MSSKYQKVLEIEQKTYPKQVSLDQPWDFLSVTSSDHETMETYQPFELRLAKSIQGD